MEVCLPSSYALLVLLECPRIHGCKTLRSHCTGMERIDGLEGPLIVRPPGVDPLAGQYDEEKIIFLTDWWARGSGT